MNPIANQVWRTKSGRLCLIVCEAETAVSKMMWFDEVEGQFSVSEIFDRLDYITDLTPADFINRVCWEVAEKIEPQF